MKVLNLYSGIGGNRKLWKNVDVTAVEIDKEIAKIYNDFFPNDNVIVDDAHEYLLKHYNDGWDFIWSSPPCVTHSQIRYNIGYKADRIYDKVKAVYPDMNLYQEIILLQHWFDGMWVVENTVPYYEPLMEYQKSGGHIFWSNFRISDVDIGNRNHRDGNVKSLQERKHIFLDRYDIKNKRQILRNCVEPELGLHVLRASQTYTTLDKWL